MGENVNYQQENELLLQEINKFEQSNRPKLGKEYEKT